MHSDFSLSFEAICSRLFLLFIISSFEHIFHILTLMIELKNSSNTSKKEFSEWAKNRRISKQSNARERQKQRRIFFSKKRQHKRTSNSNVFDQNHRVRRQKENIERQRTSNIKATTDIKTTTDIRTTTESETRKLKRQRKKLKKKTLTKEKNDEIDSK